MSNSLAGLWPFRSVPCASAPWEASPPLYSFSPGTYQPKKRGKRKMWAFRHEPQAINDGLVGWEPTWVKWTQNHYLCDSARLFFSIREYQVWAALSASHSRESNTIFWCLFPKSPALLSISSARVLLTSFSRELRPRLLRHFHRCQFSSLCNCKHTPPYPGVMTSDTTATAAPVS